MVINLQQNAQIIIMERLKQFDGLFKSSPNVRSKSVGDVENLLREIILARDEADSKPDSFFGESPELVRAQYKFLLEDELKKLKREVADAQLLVEQTKKDIGNISNIAERCQAISEKLSPNKIGFHFQADRSRADDIKRIYLLDYLKEAKRDIDIGMSAAKTRFDKVVRQKPAPYFYESDEEYESDDSDNDDMETRDTNHEKHSRSNAIRAIDVAIASIGAITNVVERDHFKQLLEAKRIEILAGKFKHEFDIKVFRREKNMRMRLKNIEDAISKLNSVLGPSCEKSTLYLQLKQERERLTQSRGIDAAEQRFMLLNFGNERDLVKICIKIESEKRKNISTQNVIEKEHYSYLLIVKFTQSYIALKRPAVQEAQRLAQIQSLSPAEVVNARLAALGLNDITDLDQLRHIVKTLIKEEIQNVGRLYDKKSAEGLYVHYLKEQLHLIDMQRKKGSSLAFDAAMSVDADDEISLVGIAPKNLNIYTLAEQHQLLRALKKNDRHDDKKTANEMQTSTEFTEEEASEIAEDIIYRLFKQSPLNQSPLNLPLKKVEDIEARLEVMVQARDDAQIMREMLDPDLVKHEMVIRVQYEALLGQAINELQNQVVDADQAVKKVRQEIEGVQDLSQRCNVVSVLQHIIDMSNDLDEDVEFIFLREYLQVELADSLNSLNREREKRYQNSKKMALSIVPSNSAAPKKHPRFDKLINRQENRKTRLSNVLDEITDIDHLGMDTNEKKLYLELLMQEKDLLARSMSDIEEVERRFWSHNFDAEPDLVRRCAEIENEKNNVKIINPITKEHYLHLLRVKFTQSYLALRKPAVVAAAMIVNAESCRFPGCKLAKAIFTAHRFHEITDFHQLRHTVETAMANTDFIKTIADRKQRLVYREELLQRQLDLIEAGIKNDGYGRQIVRETPIYLSSGFFFVGFSDQVGQSLAIGILKRNTTVLKKSNFYSDYTDDDEKTKSETITMLSVIQSSSSSLSGVQRPFTLSLQASAVVSSSSSTPLSTLAPLASNSPNLNNGNSKHGKSSNKTKPG